MISLQIRKAVVLLVRHGIVQFNLDSRNNITYQAHSENVIRLIRSPRCVLAAKTLYGESAEAICEEIVNEGRLSCSECIRRVTTRLELQDDDVSMRCHVSLSSAFFLMKNSAHCGEQSCLQRVAHFAEDYSGIYQMAESKIEQIFMV